MTETGFGSTRKSRVFFVPRHVRYLDWLLNSLVRYPHLLEKRTSLQGGLQVVLQLHWVTNHHITHARRLLIIHDGSTPTTMSLIFMIRPGWLKWSVFRVIMSPLPNSAQVPKTRGAPEPLEHPMKFIDPKKMMTIKLSATFFLDSRHK